MAYNLNPYIASFITNKVHVVRDYMGLNEISIYENIIAKANKIFRYVSGKTSRMFVL